ncbi:MAG: DUF4215 domain-containing protein [Deltaproteobacteria bacterium]|nr:DUF4215 domain-containing protein [Deltaproteobacteria bacterium]
MGADRCPALRGGRLVLLPGFVVAVACTLAACGRSAGGPDADADGESDDAALDLPEPDHGELPPATCGDGIVAPGEECDDGNRMNDDGCDWSCRLGDGETPTGPPDPDAGRLAEEAGISSINLDDIGSPGALAATDEIPLEWTGEAYATVAIHSPLEPGTGDGQATFFKFDTAGNRVGRSWTYPFISEWFPFDLAWSGSGFGLCFGDGSDDSTKCVMLDGDGKPTSDPFAIGVWSARELLGPPLRVVGDGAGWAVSWRGLQFAKLDESGRHRDEGTRSLEAYLPYSSTLAWSGTSYLLTWLAQGATPDEVAVRYLVLDAELTPLAGPRILGPANGWSESRSRGVWLGDRFAIGWVGPPFDPSAPVSTCPLYVARLDRSGSLLGPPTTLPDEATALPSDIFGFSATAGANSIAIVLSVGEELRLVRFDREGVFIEQVDLLVDHTVWWTAPDGPLGIAFDGSGFGVVMSYAGGSILPRLVRWALLP